MTGWLRGSVVVGLACGLGLAVGEGRVGAGVAPQGSGGVELAPYRAAWLALPPFDAGLAPGEVEVALRPVLWAPRRPGWHEDGLTADWPIEVEALLLENARRPCSWGCEPVPSVHGARPGQPWPADLPAFRAILPGGFEVYTLEHGLSTFIERHLILCLREPRSGRLSSRPVTLVRRWTAMLSEGPMAWSADLDGDGRAELGLLVTHHNGTVEHGTGIAWFGFAEDLAPNALRRSIHVEEIRAVSHGEAGVIRSRLVRTRQGELREEAWYENPAFATAPRRVPADELEAIRVRLGQHERLFEPRR